MPSDHHSDFARLIFDGGAEREQLAATAIADNGAALTIVFQLVWERRQCVLRKVG